MKEMENKSKLYNDKMQDLKSILEFLSSEFNVQYAFNYTKMSDDNKQILSQDMLYSKGLNNDVSNHFIDNLIRYQEYINKIPNLIRQGEFVVKCMDDDLKPEGIGDWLEKGLHYIVDSMQLTADGNYAYVLRGMKVNKPYTGYSMKRFQRVYVADTLN